MIPTPIARSVALSDFVVPPRFASATFASYRPDPAHPSQAAAVARLSEIVRGRNGARRAGIAALVSRFRQTGARPGGVYLDGSYGVGKTHLLAAAWHAASVPKAYLTFAELTYAVGSMGMARVLELFGTARLVCIDEFELDDPGNTMLATAFVRGAVERGATVIVTSNTLPDELGRGRFSEDEFAREIGSLADAFETLRIEGEDYRHRHFGAGNALPRLLPLGAPLANATPWEQLLRTLTNLHPLHYRALAASLSGYVLTDVRPIPDQDTALRFVHFMDAFYDARIPLAMTSAYRPEELFPANYGYGPFVRKFRRCRSRLQELLGEAQDEWLVVSDRAAADD